MILTTFALPAEAQGFVARLRHRVRSGITLVGDWQGHQVGVVYLGIGLRHRDALERYLERWRPKLVLCSGFAGALRSLLHPGDFVAACNLSTPELITAHQTQFDALGDFLTVHTVASAQTKRQLARGGRHLALDMESAAVNELCHARGLPVLVARMISDGVNQEVPGLFLGRSPHGPRDFWEAGTFAGRMLRLRPRLADRLCGLIRQLDGATARMPNGK